MTLPITAEQWTPDPPMVYVALDQMLDRVQGTPEWDGFTLSLTPDRADEIGRALISKAAAARAGDLDTFNSDGDDS